MGLSVPSTVTFELSGCFSGSGFGSGFGSAFASGFGLGFSGTLISMLLTASPPLQIIFSLIFSGLQHTTVMVTVPAFLSYIWF
jgi:hypothetical protein